MHNYYKSFFLIHTLLQEAEAEAEKLRVEEEALRAEQQAMREEAEGMRTCNEMYIHIHLIH